VRIAGIEIGGTKLQVVLGDENGRIHDRIAHAIDASQGAAVIRGLIEGDLKKFGKVDAVGVGFGGPVNRLTGEIWTSYHVTGWTGFNISGWLGEVTRSPVIIENDANTAALGEAVCGAGDEHKIVFYVTVGSGVGGGVVIDRKIYHGRLPGEVEFGHIRLDVSGGILQDSCSGWAVNEKIRKRVLMKPGSLLAKLASQNKGIEAKSLLQAIEADDPDAMEIFGATMTDLAFGLSHAVHLFHPDTIIIGGGLSLIGEPLLRMVEQKMKIFVMDAFQPGPVVQLSALKSDAVPVGALILAGQDIKKVSN
jgi:glucokinase